MLSTIVRTLVLAVVWAALQGAFDVPNLLFGLLLGLGVTVFAQPIFDRDDPSEHRSVREGGNPALRIWRFVVLLLVFLRELLMSSLRVASITVAPTIDVRSGVVEYPLDVTTDREITALANLITLTPGTMTLDVAPDKRRLYIHTMAVETDDGSEVIAEIKDSLEKHVHLAFGPATRGEAETTDADA